ncbi:HD domain-containing protein [Methanospirillum sp. J.3.6.1-F.2.7.3]|jgi:hypothetical protein|uniref:HD domain-containing protein n=1 Tax=Methanospirillum purgamenti TaxID=2834276 RepID=A0A8E7AY13_9EURY|nr:MULTISPECIES: HD domain-containing protein [Methanospirillum]MDX8551882.1 HD domain-containing protein [Methanospirillum hungatei]QVV88369.1 HD domain-containing protein [Methanospirillum sp. J.3.6.1-F.2.7.3]
MKKALLFGGTDGHGMTMTAISRRALEQEGYDVTTICNHQKPPITLPENAPPSDYGTGTVALFWGSTFLFWDFSKLSQNDLVVVVDIPLPEPDKRYPGCTAEKGIEKIKELCKNNIRVLIIDHHKIATTYYGKAIEVGAEIVISAHALTTHYGFPDPFSIKWGTIGAICDRDSAILPVTTEEEELARALDQAKFAGTNTLEAIYSDNMRYLTQDIFKNPLKPDEKHVIKRDNVIYYANPTPFGVGMKLLDMLCQREDKEYGISYTPEPSVILTITNWKKKHLLPAALKLGLEKFLGHAEAPNFTYPIGEIESLISRLNAVYIQGNEQKIESSNVYTYFHEFMKKIKIPYFLTIHGWSHVEHVISHARTLGSLCSLAESEQKILDWACLLHDVGNGAEGIDGDKARACHHLYSFQMIREWDDKGFFTDIMTPNEVRKVADLCFRHRKFLPLPEEESMKRLCVLLRVADSMDIDERRAMGNDEGESYQSLKSKLPESSIEHWESHQGIKGIRLYIKKNLIEFQIFIKDKEKAAFQINNFMDEIKILSMYFNLNINLVEMPVLSGNTWHLSRKSDEWVGR